MSADLVVRYAELTATGRTQLAQEEHERAIETFAEARRIAEQLQDQQLLFRATCNLSSVKLNMGRLQESEEGLREILLKSEDPHIVFAAAWYLASALRRQGRLEKALFYAKRALRSSDRIDDNGWKASCHNLIGNIYMNMSYLDDALAEYERRRAEYENPRQNQDEPEGLTLAGGAAHLGQGGLRPLDEYRGCSP